MTDKSQSGITWSESELGNSRVVTSPLRKQCFWVYILVWFGLHFFWGSWFFWSLCKGVSLQRGGILVPLYVYTGSVLKKEAFPPEGRGSWVNTPEDQESTKRTGKSYLQGRKQEGRIRKFAEIDFVKY